MMTADIIILAAGSSSRFESDKIFADVRGLPLIVRTLKAFDDFKKFSTCIVVYKDNDDKKISTLCSKYNIKMNVVYVKGGSTRAESSYNALKTLRDSTSEFVAVTDADRCFVSQNLLSRLFDSAVKCGNAVPALRHPETLKVIEDGFVRDEMKNPNLYEIQTPQFFKRDKLIKAFAGSFSAGANDESAVYFSFYKDEKMNVVQGDGKNIKVTYKSDLISR